VKEVRSAVERRKFVNQVKYLAIHQKKLLKNLMKTKPYKKDVKTELAKDLTQKLRKSQ
jgi:hypothetical protein